MLRWFTGISYKLIRLAKPTNVGEDLAWELVGDDTLGDARVGAADPDDGGSLGEGQVVEEPRVRRVHGGRPLSVSLKEGDGELCYRPGRHCGEYGQGAAGFVYDTGEWCRRGVTTKGEWTRKKSPTTVSLYAV
jgi:hypothetical protein